MQNGNYEPTLPLNLLVPSRTNINYLSPDKMETLTRAMEDGMRDPVEVCVLTAEFPEFESPGRYLIVDGHHRVEAARRLQLSAVPALVFAYSLQEARVRMLQANTLRGRVIRDRVGDLLRGLDMGEKELQVLSGIHATDIRKLRALNPVAAQPAVRTTWEMVRIAIAEDAGAIYREALRAAQLRLQESRELLPLSDVAAWCAETARVAEAYPDQFLLLLLQLLLYVEAELNASAPLVGEAAGRFKRAMKVASKLGESEAQGRALEFMAVEFLNLPKESYRT